MGYAIGNNIDIYQVTTKSNENTDKIKINILQP